MNVFQHVMLTRHERRIAPNNGAALATIAPFLQFKGQKNCARTPAIVGLVGAGKSTLLLPITRHRVTARFDAG